MSPYQQLHESLKQKILQTYSQMPEHQQRIADYLLQHGKNVGLLTTDSIARHLKVSKATVVRFAQTLGYDGFIELRNEILEFLRSDLKSVDKFMVSIGKQSIEDTLTLVAKHEVQNINKTIQQIDRAAFTRCVELILSARRAVTMGIGVSSLLAEVLAYELHQVAIEARPLSTAHIRFVESLAIASPKDVVIAFSFPPYSKETIDAAAYTHQRKIPVIAFTDRLTSPITFHTDTVLVVRSENMLFTNSIAAISVVINALATNIAAKNKKQITSTFKESSRILEETSQFYQ
jgi:DNA-binding MurR/RpiR family transcriptional regulator